MTAEMKNDVLRQVLFMTMVNSLKNYEQNGILEKVVQEKIEQDLREGPAKVQHYGLTSAEQFLQFSTDTFACAHWAFERDAQGVTATTKGCVVCGMAKQAGAPSPCELTCISPVRGVIKGLNPNNQFEVKETLWESDRCVFRIDTVE